MSQNFCVADYLNIRTRCIGRVRQLQGLNPTHLFPEPLQLVADGDIKFPLDVYDYFIDIFILDSAVSVYETVIYTISDPFPFLFHFPCPSFHLLPETICGGRNWVEMEGNIITPAINRLALQLLQCKIELHLFVAK